MKSFMVAHLCRKSQWELLLSNWVSLNAVGMVEFLGNIGSTLNPQRRGGLVTVVDKGAKVVIRRSDSLRPMILAS